MAGLSLSFFLMRVEEDRRSEWEAYSVANKGWMQEGLGYIMGVNPADTVAAPALPVTMDTNSNPAPNLLEIRGLDHTTRFG